MLARTSTRARGHALPLPELHRERAPTRAGEHAQHQRREARARGGVLHVRAAPPSHRRGAGALVRRARCAVSHAAHWCHDPSGCDDHGGRQLAPVTLCTGWEAPPECDAGSPRFLARCRRRDAGRAGARWAQLDLFAPPPLARRA